MLKLFASRMTNSQRRKALRVAGSRRLLLQSMVGMKGQAAKVRPPASLKGPRDIVRAAFGL